MINKNQIVEDGMGVGRAIQARGIASDELTWLNQKTHKFNEKEVRCHLRMANM